MQYLKESEVLNKNLTNFRRALLTGIVIIAITANTLTTWESLAFGQVAFILFILMIGTYLFEVAFHSVGTKDE